MFKDFLDYKDPKKGYIVNDSFNNPTILDTGFHRYKNVYNFYNNAKAGQIGAVKSIVNQNNNILWTPNQSNNIEMNLVQSSSSISTNPDNFLPEDIGIDYDSYWEYNYTATGGYGYYNPCSCSSGYVYVPVAIKIIDYNLNGKVPFVFIGNNRVFNPYTSGYCPTQGIIGAGYYIIEKYMISSDGVIPRPRIDIDYAYWQPMSCRYFIPAPGSITYIYATWNDFCEYFKQGYFDFNIARLFIEVYQLKAYYDCCNNTYIYLWDGYWDSYLGNILPSGEYVKVRVYEKRIPYLCIT